MDFSTLLTSDSILLILALWVIGIGLKRANFVKDELIIFIISVIGMLGAMSLYGFTARNALIGIFCAGLAVYGQNLVKQAGILSGLVKDPNKFISGVLDSTDLEPIDDSGQASSDTKPKDDAGPNSGFKKE